MGSFAWNNRAMFERYVYDYFVKRNMHETAEIFRRETNLTIESIISPNVPDGFLREWWLIFHDIFGAYHPNIPQHSDRLFYMAEKMMNMGQPSVHSSSAQHEFTEQMIRELISNDFVLTKGGNQLSSRSDPSIGYEQVSQGCTLSLPVLESQTSTPVICNPECNIGSIVAQEIGSLVHAAPKMENVSPNENRRKRKISSDSGDRSNGFPGATECPSETQSPLPKCLDDFLILSCSYADESRDESRTSSSNSLTSHTIADAQDSEVHPVVESYSKS